MPLIDGFDDTSILSISHLGIVAGTYESLKIADHNQFDDGVLVEERTETVRGDGHEPDEEADATVHDEMGVFSVSEGERGDEPDRGAEEDLGVAGDPFFPKIKRIAPASQGSSSASARAPSP